MRYRLNASTSLDYPFAPTLKVLSDVLGEPTESVALRVGAVDKKALEAVLKEAAGRLDKPRVALLKAELDAHAEKKISPRFTAKAVA
jgi:hypothetical protein